MLSELRAYGWRFWTCQTLAILLVLEAESLALIPENPDGSPYPSHYTCGEYCDPLHLMLFRAFRYIVDALDRHEGTVVGVATAFVALFTFALFRATRKLWEAGEKQIAVAQQSANAATLAAQAAIGMEIPRVLVAEVDFWPEQDFIRQKLQNSEIIVRLKNFGRNQAYVGDNCIFVTVANDLPKIPIYESIYHADPSTIIEPNKFFSLKKTGRIAEPDIEEVVKWAADGAKLWVYGFLKYRDFLDTEHSTGFCYRLHRTRGLLREGCLFLRGGPDGYTYHT